MGLGRSTGYAAVKAGRVAVDQGDGSYPHPVRVGARTAHAQRLTSGGGRVTAKTTGAETLSPPGHRQPGGDLKRKGPSSDPGTG